MAVNMLDAKQEREYNRDVKLQQFLLDKKNEYNTFAPFNNIVQLFMDNITRIDPLVPVKAKKGVIITEGKNKLKAALAADVNNVCTNATEYAISISDMALQNAVRFRTSDIANARDGNVPAIVTTITEALTPLLTNAAFQKYEITATMLSALTAQAEAFSDTRGKAAVIDTGSSIANNELNEVFKDIRSNIASLRRLLTHFNIKNPGFVTGFNTSAAVDTSGIRHSGIEGITKNSSTGAPLEGVTITGEGKKKIVTTDKYGVYRLVKLKVTDMKITIAAPGYDTQVINVKIIRGRIQELNINLQSQVIRLSATA